MNDTVARLVAQTIIARGTTRVFGLEGGHIQPIWDELVQAGVPIVDVRDERAAVHMAHAHAELTGETGVVLVTAGPGVTNAITGVANAFVARTPILVIGGCVPRPQRGLGALQDVPQVPLLTPVTRLAVTTDLAEHALRDLARAFDAARGGRGAPPGPVYLEIPTDVLREPFPAALRDDALLGGSDPAPIVPDPDAVAAAADLIWTARRPVVITGRGARESGEALRAFLDASGAVYLDTQESRGLVAESHPSVVGAMRGGVMQESDCVITVGRKLDYQLGYGSRAVWPNARFVRIADNADEVRDNRPGEVEMLATPALALDAIARAAAGRTSAVDRNWTQALRARHVDRTTAYAQRLDSAPAGADGRMHPNAIFAAIRAVVPGDAIAIADGGDILSFARIGLANETYLDSGVLGCLGVGVPFAIAAALAHPERAVIAVCGDGAFGFNAIEIDTAVRHDARAVFIVANNAAWNIERYDQDVNYGGRIAGTELRWSDYAGLARALGAYAERIDDPRELSAALTRAIDRAPALLDVVVTRDAVSPDGGRGLGFVPAYQPLAAWDEAERRRRVEVPT